MNPIPFLDWKPEKKNVFSGTSSAWWKCEISSGPIPGGQEM